MKLTVPSQNIQTGNTMGGNNFSIKATGKAFRILSSGLYSDKILAIVRELSCNCVDAHILGGNTDEPFWMHLPNRLEPYVAFRDFGVGLSHEDVLHLFTTYFESTKQDSNDFIGALGLGSKSPFSYVDSFNVISFFNGMKRTYTAYLGDDGTPCIVLMSEEETDERNGLYIEIAVKDHDFERFANRTKSALHYFAVKPQVVGYADFEFDTLEHLVSGDGWGIRDTTINDNDEGKPKALQGNVAYPLEKDKLQGASDKVNALLSLPIDITFDMGELDVQASREGLSYDKPTQQNIIARSEKIYDAIIEQLQDNFTECKTQWDAYALFNKLFHHENGLMGETFRGMAKRGELTIEWNGVKLSGSNHFIDVNDMPHDDSVATLGSRYQEVIIKSYFRKEKNRTLTPSNCVENSYSNLIPRSMSGRSAYMIRAATKPVFLVNDIGNGAIARSRRWALEQGHDRIYLLDVTDTNKDNRAQADALLKQAMDLLQLTEDDITYVSETPGPTKRVNGAKGPSVQRVKSTGVFYYSGSYESGGYYNRPRPLSYSWDMIEDEELDDHFEEGGVYVELTAFKPVGTPGFQNYSNTGWWDFLEMVNKSTVADLTEMNIVGVRKAKLKKYQESDKWVNIFDYVQREVKKVARKNVVRDIAIAEKRNYLKNQVGNTIPLDADAITSMRRQTTGTQFSEFLGKMRKVMKRDATHLKPYENILRTFNMYDESQKEVAEEFIQGFHKEWNTILEKYPLLKLMSSYNVRDAMKDMTQYISLVDKDSKAA